MKKVILISGTVLAVLVVLLSLVGCTGAKVVKGDKGDTGATGATGAQGLQGIQGNQGIQGIQGIQGLKGDKGDTGAQGTQGIQGLKGDKGDTGAIGATGATGAQGIQGATGSIGIGISNAVVDASGNLVLYLSNGMIVNTGNVRGSAGATGATGATGAKGSNGISAPVVRLVPKDATTWAVINGNKGGLLEYTATGHYFGYVFSGFGLTPNTNYSLIYYADFPDRVNNWGGNNPGAFIASGVSDGNGNINLIGEIGLNMNLPSAPDANIAQYSYNGAPDYYANAHGAKIWLVPSSVYDSPSHKLTAWTPQDFLFETDLVNYTYTP